MCCSLLVHIILETDIDLSGCFEDDGQREGTWQPCTVDAMVCTCSVNWSHSEM